MTRTVAAMLLLASCARPSAPPRVDQSMALVRAVRADSIGVVRELLAAGVEPDTITNDGTRPLTEAARHGPADAVQALLAAGADPLLADSQGNRPFDYAMESGRRDILEQLARAAASRAGANSVALRWFDSTRRGVEASRGLDGEIASLAAVFAVLANRIDAVRELRRVASMSNPLGYRALVVAARLGDRASVAALLSASANPDEEVVGHRGETALMEAARDGYVDVARELLHAGARVDHVDRDQRTALMWAVDQGETAYAELLLAAGADPNRENGRGESALDMAHRINHADLVELLERYAARRTRRSGINA